MRRFALGALMAGVCIRSLLAPVAAEAIHREVLPNGAVVIVQNRPGSGTFAARVVARGGRFEDPVEQYGLTPLLARMLLRGTTRLGTFEYSLAVEKTGSTAAPLALRLGTGLSAEGPSAAAGEVLGLLLQAALSPRLLPEDLAKEVGLMRQSLRTSLDRPSTVLDRAAYPILFGNHPLGRTADPDTWLSGITSEDLRRVHERRFTGRRLVVILVGEIDITATLTLAGTVLKGLPPGEGPPASPPPPAPLPTLRKKKARGKTTQPELLVAYPTGGIADQDQAAMDLLMHILTGYDERIPAEIREERGWAYWVSGVDWRFPEAGLYGVRTAVPRKRLEESATIILQEMAWIGEQPPSLEELARARRFLTTARARGWQRSGSRASWFMAWELKDQPLMTYDAYVASLERVSPLQVRDLARGLLEHSSPAIVTLH